MVDLGSRSIRQYLSETTCYTLQSKFISEPDMATLREVLSVAQRIAQAKKPHTYQIDLLRVHTNKAFIHAVYTECAQEKIYTILWDQCFWELYERFLYMTDFITYYPDTPDNADIIQNNATAYLYYQLALKFYEFPFLSNQLMSLAKQHNLMEVLKPLIDAVSGENELQMLLSKMYYLENLLSAIEFENDPLRRKITLQVFFSQSRHDTFTDERNVPPFAELQANESLYESYHDLALDICSMQLINRSLQATGMPKAKIASLIGRVLIVMGTVLRSMREASVVWEDALKQGPIPKGSMNSGWPTLPMIDWDEGKREFYCQIIGKIVGIESNIILHEVDETCWRLEPYAEALRYLTDKRRVFETIDCAYQRWQASDGSATARKHEEDIRNADLYRGL